MSKPKLEALYIHKIIGFDILELRLDWNNDRHHAIKIDSPFGPDEVQRALLYAAHQIGNDPELNGEPS